MNKIEFFQLIAMNKSLRAQLREDAKATLNRLGMETGDTQIKVVEDSNTVSHFAIPPNPNEQMGDQDLENISAGGFNPFSNKSWKKFGKDARGGLKDAVKAVDDGLASI